MKALPVKHSTLRIGELNTWGELQAALDGMEMHHANFCGGLKAFNRCGKIEWTIQAEKKRQAIRAKLAKLDAEEDDE